jgi:hypothetical protein
MTHGNADTPAPPRASAADTTWGHWSTGHDCERLSWVLSVIYITDSAARFSRVGFWQVKSGARADQLITFARCRHEAPPIHNCDLA